MAHRVVLNEVDRDGLTPLPKFRASRTGTAGLMYQVSPMLNASQRDNTKCDVRCSVAARRPKASIILVLSMSGLCGYVIPYIESSSSFFSRIS